MEFKGHMKCHGTATVGERGQVVLPSELRKTFNINPGEKLIVLGIDHNGFERIIMMKSAAVTKMFQHLLGVEKFMKEGNLEKLRGAIEETGVKKIAKPIARGKKKGLKFKVDV